MIVPWSLEPAGEEVKRVRADTATTLTPPQSQDVVAVAIVIESPALRAAYLGQPKFLPADEQPYGLLLHPGEHVLPIVSATPLRLISDGEEAVVSLIWLKRRAIT